ncbi:UNVERIFIED_CONTAM: hypothetical protein NCL1_16617 [Trichonephila clavipes]
MIADMTTLRLLVVTSTLLLAVAVQASMNNGEQGEIIAELPTQPMVFNTPDELRTYLQELDKYFAIVGRPSETIDARLSCCSFMEDSQKSSSDVGLDEHLATAIPETFILTFEQTPYHPPPSDILPLCCSQRELLRRGVSSSVRTREAFLSPIESILC